MAGSNIQKPALYALSAIVILGTAYSVAYDTYLDTSNPLLTHLPHPLGATHYFASKRNFLNVYFIKVAWGWTSGVFLLSWLTSPTASTQSQRRGRGAYRRLATYLSLTALWILFTSWFFGPAILDRVVVLTGGECVLTPRITDPTTPNAFSPGPPLVVPTEYCFTKSTITSTSHPALFQSLVSDPSAGLSPDTNALTLGGVPRLRRGHDVSGHIFLLTMSVLLLTEQLQASFSEDQGRWSAVHRVSVLLNAALVGVWLWASATTSVYFHSPLEKVTGLALGLAAYGLTQLPFILFQTHAGAESPLVGTPRPSQHSKKAL